MHTLLHTACPVSSAKRLNTAMTNKAYCFIRMFGKTCHTPSQSAMHTVHSYLSAFDQRLDERANACQCKPVGIFLSQVTSQKATVQKQRYMLLCHLISSLVLSAKEQPSQRSPASSCQTTFPEESLQLLRLCHEVHCIILLEPVCKCNPCCDSCSHVPAEFAWHFCQAGLMEVGWVTGMWGGLLMLPSSVKEGSIKQRQPCVIYATVIAQQRRQSAFAR